MLRTYVVRAGDTLSRIAHTNGLNSWRDVYYHPGNAQLRIKRPNPDLIFPGDTLVLPTPAVAAPAVGYRDTPWAHPQAPAVNLFLTPSDLFRLDQIINGPLSRPGDPLRDIERALKALGPAAKESNGIDDLAQKLKKHMEIHAGDWTIKPDVETIAKGLRQLLQKHK
jgi:hypothetical protein